MLAPTTQSMHVQLRKLWKMVQTFQGGKMKTCKVRVNPKVMGMYSCQGGCLEKVGPLYFRCSFPLEEIGKKTMGQGHILSPSPTTSKNTHQKGGPVNEQA